MEDITEGAINIVTVDRDQISSNFTTGESTSSRPNTENRFIISKHTKDTAEVNSKDTDASIESNDDSDIEEKIMAVYWRSGSLGAAYYNIQTSELHVLEEIVDCPPDYQLFGSLYRQVAPSLVLSEGKAHGSFVTHLRSVLFQHKGTTHCKLVFLSAKEYNYEACKRRIFTLSLACEPRNCSEEERAVYLRTVVNFGEARSTHALGALLRYLDLNWTNLNLSLHEKPSYMTVKKISLADMMCMDEDTYRGLQIFSSAAHPSAFKRGVRGSTKEGLSLFALYNKCCSKVGQARMRVLLQHPTRDVATLRRRHDALAYLMRPQHEPTVRNLCSSLRHIRNVNGILAKIKSLSAKPYQWKSLYNTLYNAVLICEMLEHARDSQLLEELACSDNTKLYEMALYLNRIIDFNVSRTEGKFTVKPGVDPDLDKKKQTMSNLHGLMSERAREELARLPEYVQECSMLYMPHLGYLLAVRSSDASAAPNNDLPGLRFMFQNNDYIHYKSRGCEELDVMIGDTYPEIIAHETKIMMRLSDLVMENLQSLAAIIDKCAELDCLIAMSKVCKEFGFVRPIITDEKAIRIKQGKHPLHLICSENFVPNDTTSTKEDGFVKILTGASSSGKSVYLKQVALVCYLAHVGSFVPAERAEISPLARLHTRLQSAECVAAHMSAFLIDLRQMALALQESSSDSLIIIDEFGKGTSEVDGLALLAACLNQLLFQGEHCPHVLVSTHFLNLGDFLVKTPLVRFQTFEHVMQDDEPVFLFRLTDGTAERSFAIEVAAANGLEPHLLVRAATVQRCITENKLPPANKKVTAKLKTFIESIKANLLAEDI